MRNIFTISLIIAGIFIGFFAGIWYSKKPASGSYPVREDSPQYKFINPLLFTENGPIHSAKYEPLEDVMNSFVASVKKKGDADSVSIYLRDMNTGTWTGVNEDEKYEPSSMLKVALLMADLQLAEKNPNFLVKKAPYEQKYTADQYYKPADKLSNGNYSIQELINSMIVDSDNDAANTLFNENPNGFKELYQALQLPTPSKDTPDYMSAKSYSSIFRVLYNASYLSRDMSEKALRLLSTTDFKNGLIAGLPADVVVSHKFGENTIRYRDGTIQGRELHDCGIVYSSNSPYFLCVMSKGKDFSKLEGVISAISNMVYTSIDKVSK